MLGRCEPTDGPAHPARRRRPVVVRLLDVMMPGIDAWDVCRQIKSTPDAEDVGVILLSATRRTRIGGRATLSAWTTT